MMKAQPKAKAGIRIGFQKNPIVRRPSPRPGSIRTSPTAHANSVRYLQKLLSKWWRMVVKDCSRRSAERSVLSKVSRQEKHQTIITKAILQLGNAGPFPLIYAAPTMEVGTLRRDGSGERGRQGAYARSALPDTNL